MRGQGDSPVARKSAITGSSTLSGVKATFIPVSAAKPSSVRISSASKGLRFISRVTTG
jgi:hypothetical protein